jgi:hypothetical protein
MSIAAGGLEALPKSQSLYPAESPKRNGSETISTFLGWFSIGLGLAELCAPRQVARATGMRDRGANLTWLRLMGIREIAVGVGVLSQPANPAWLWARVAGDLIDMGLLAAAARQPRAHQGRLATAALSVAAVTALDAGTGRRLQRHEARNGQA